MKPTGIAACGVAGLLLMSGCGESVTTQEPTPSPNAIASPNATVGSESEVVLPRGDAAGTGEFDKEPLRKLSDKEGGLKWKARPEKALATDIAPINVGGVLYTLYSYSESNSTDLWEMLASAKANLIAMDAETGQMKWRFAGEGSSGPAPVYAGGVVYFITTDSDTTTSNLYAVNTADGKEVWHFRRADARFGGMVVAGDTLYFLSDETFANLHLYALDRRTGQEKWQFQARALPAATPVVADGALYFTTGWVQPTGSSAIPPAIYALDAGTGQQMWQVAPEAIEGQSQAGVSAPLVVAEGSLFYVGYYGTLHALDVANGHEEWQFDPGFVGTVRSPAVGNGTAYVIGEEALYAVDAGTGKEQWKTAIHYGSATPPIIAGDMLYLGNVESDRDSFASSPDLIIYGISRADGKALWSYKVQTSGNRISDLTTSDRVVYFSAGDDSYTYALQGEK